MIGQNIQVITFVSNAFKVPGIEQTTKEVSSTPWFHVHFTSYKPYEETLNVSDHSTFLFIFNF